MDMLLWQHQNVEYIRQGAKQNKQRTGQWLFNHLPDGAANVVAGTLFDPFHKDLSDQEIYEWLDNHLIFDGNGTVIAVFCDNKILWEA